MPLLLVIITLSKRWIFHLDETHRFPTGRNTGTIFVYPDHRKTPKISLVYPPLTLVGQERKIHTDTTYFKFRNPTGPKIPTAKPGKPPQPFFVFSTSSQQLKTAPNHPFSLPGAPFLIYTPIQWLLSSLIRNIWCYNFNRLTPILYCWEVVE